VSTTDLWWLTLGLGAVVIAVVAVLLLLILAAASRIDRRAAEIWQVGKDIARNTAAIWMLQQVNTTAGQLLAGAAAIAETTGSIDRRLASLSGSLSRQGQ
jgi:hypothetical protein